MHSNQSKPKSYLCLNVCIDCVCVFRLLDDSCVFFVRLRRTRGSTSVRSMKARLAKKRPSLSLLPSQNVNGSRDVHIFLFTHSSSQTAVTELLLHFHSQHLVDVFILSHLHYCIQFDQLTVCLRVQKMQLSISEGGSDGLWITNPVPTYHFYSYYQFNCTMIKL